MSTKNCNRLPRITEIIRAKISPSRFNSQKEKLNSNQEGN